MSHLPYQAKLRWMVGLMVIGLVASACSFAVARTAELGASCDQFSSQRNVSEQADLVVGDVLTVTLCSNPTTGFSWQEPAISDAAVIRLVDKTFSAPAASETAPLVGAAGSESISLKATAKGTSTVVLEYSQPWIGGTSGEWTYTLTVTVS